MYLGLEDKGNVFGILKNWPERRVKAVCLTDGQRVGSLGDLGVQVGGRCRGAVAKLGVMWSSRVVQRQGRSGAHCSVNSATAGWAMAPTRTAPLSQLLL